jgi:hypothetical protein
MDQLREILVYSWYSKNLVAIGPHTKDTALAIKQEKLEEIRKSDPAINNSKEIWDSVLPRLFVTITGENYDLSEQVQDLTQLIGFEQDPDRINWILDQVYRSRNIPIPPKKKEQPPQMLQINSQQAKQMNGSVPQEEPMPANA